MRLKGSSVTDEGPGRTPFGFIVYSYQVKNKNFAKQPLQGSNRKRSAPNASAFYYFKKSTIFEKSSFASLKMAVYLFLTNLSAFVLLPLAALNPRHLFLFAPVGIPQLLLRRKLPVIACRIADLAAAMGLSLFRFAPQTRI
ncbi:MAG: hypothetical protein ACLRYD_17845 [Ruminococcus callidus]